MVQNNALGRILVLAFALVVFPAASGHAQRTKPAAKAAKPAKSRSAEAPPAVQMTLEPKAMEILKAACSRLAAARAKDLQR